MPSSSNPFLKPTSRRPGLFRWLGAFWFTALAVPVCFGQNATAKPETLPPDLRSAMVEDKRVPATPAAVIDVLEIQPFRLKVGYSYGWLASQPLVSDGLLVVLRVDPRYVVPRNTAEPVLFAGDRTVQRLNQGNGSGYVIGIIPGELDLATEPIWFGRPQLPERVTPEVITEERELADRAGIKAFGADKIAGARRDPIDVDDLAVLLRGAAADLVLNYSPDEKHLAETWRLPTTGSGRPR
jgi:hypothetical protein